MKQINARWIALMAITAITVFVVWLMLKPFLNVLLWSMVLTVIASPLNNALRKWGRSANVAAMITMASVIFVVVIPAFFIISAAAKHAPEAIDALEAGYTRLADPESAPSHLKSPKKPERNISWTATITKAPTAGP